MITMFPRVWAQYKGVRNIIVPDIKLHKGLMRDLSKEKEPARLLPEEVLSYMRKEDGWTDEMIAEIVQELKPI